MAATASNRGSSGAYSAKQTGATSRFGGAAGGTVRRVLNPWGNSVPQATATRSTPLGVTPSRAKLTASGVRQPTPDSSLWSVPYKANDPNAWPLMVDDGHGNLIGTKSGPTSGMTQAKADRYNAILNNAYVRGGYAG